MTDRQRLLKQIQIHDFILFEAALFLDTHKTDKDALAYYRRHKAMAEELKCEFVKKYGPLTINDNNADTVWDWVKGPWPWEYESEVK